MSPPLIRQLQRHCSPLLLRTSRHAALLLQLVNQIADVDRQVDQVVEPLHGRRGIALFFIDSIEASPTMAHSGRMTAMVKRSRRVRRGSRSRERVEAHR